MIVPVLLGAFALGGAFDFLNLQSNTKYQIFDYNSVKDNIEVVYHKKTSSEYKVVESSKEALSLFDVHPFITLKAMNGEVGFVGFANYASQVVDRTKIVEIVISQKIVNIMESFSSRTKQGKGWQNKPQSEVGTHYVDSILYGGHLFISIRLEPHRSVDIEEVRSIVSSKIETGGSPGSDFFRRLEELTPALAGKATVKLQVMSTGGTYSVPTKLSDIEALFNDFPEIVEGIDGGKGAALTLHLKDLHDVQPKFKKFAVSRQVRDQLPEIEDMYDDLRLAHQQFREWQRESTSDWTADQQEQIEEYSARVRRAYRAMKIAITHLDITGSASQFDEALAAYDYDEQRIIGRYVRELRQLIKDLVGNSLFGTIY